MNRSQSREDGATHKPTVRMVKKCDVCYGCKSASGITVTECDGLLAGYWEAVCAPCDITVFGKSRTHAMREWNECQRILNSKMIS